ncbi:MAG: GAF domain-containing protein, partial [Candidatus Omnitrophica bacterium]|nr:GAF domain-containing protein [Candidatus Omnitrophota bacterium]
MANHKKALLSAGSLQYKLRIAFCLMSILPLLVSAFFVSNYILPKAGFKLDITIAISIIVSIFVSIVGFFVVKEVFDRVVSISSDAKMIVQGDTSRMVETGKEDEVGFLGDSLNQLTMQIRSNMEELKGYSERTTEINFEIQKRVLALSSLLQISSLISQGLKLDEVLRLTIEKAHLLANSEIAFLFSRVSDEDNFYLKTAEGQNSVYLAKLKIDTDDPVFNKLIHYSKPLMLDSENILSGNSGAVFYDKFRLRNVLALPIFLRGRVTGIMGIGNNKEEFVYKKDDLELLDIFSKQISIAIENDLLSHWVEKLEIKDALTGLYNGAFIKSRLQEEIK